MNNNGRQTILHLKNIHMHYHILLKIKVVRFLKNPAYCDFLSRLRLRNKVRHSQNDTVNIITVLINVCTLRKSIKNVVFVLKYDYFGKDTLYSNIQQ